MSSRLAVSLAGLWSRCQACNLADRLTDLQSHWLATSLAGVECPWQAYDVPAILLALV